MDGDRGSALDAVGEVRGTVGIEPDEEAEALWPGEARVAEFLNVVWSERGYAYHVLTVYSAFGDRTTVTAVRWPDEVAARIEAGQTDAADPAVGAVVARREFAHPVTIAEIDGWARAAVAKDRESRDSGLGTRDSGKVRGTDQRPGGPARLSPRQRDVLAVIEAYTASHGWAPSVREIRDRLGVRSVATVRQHLAALVRKGRVVRQASLPRAMRVVRG